MNNSSSEQNGAAPSFNHHVDPLNAVHHHIERIQFPATEKLNQLILRALKGAFMGALGILLPALLYYRKRPVKTIQTKALALGVFVGGSRALDGLINYLAARSDHYYNRMRQAISDHSGNNRKKVYQIPSPSLARIILKLMQEHTFAVSTGLASGAAMLIDDALCNSVVVLWLLIRALRYYVPSVPGGSIIVMCLSASQILSTWIRAPDQHSPSYLKFLDHQGGKPRSKLNLARQDRPTLDTACTLIHHPPDAHYSHVLTFFFEGLRRALPVYIPIHMLSFVLQTWNRRAHLSIPVLINQIKFTGFGLLRSCSFLSAYCTIAWFSACLYYSWFPGVTREALCVHTWTAGLALLLERPSRRPELAAYCLTQALNSVYNYAKHRNWVKPRQSATIFAIIISVGLIVFQHRNSKLLMQLLFGRYPTQIVVKDHHAKQEEKKTNKTGLN